MGVSFSELALIYLAAGESRRFGAAKLLAPLGGQPLGLHAAQMFSGIPFRARIVVGAPELNLAALDFELAASAGPGAPMSASLALGVAAARAHAPKAIMIALADMPFVTADHVTALVAAFDGDRIASASGDGAVTPPAIIGAVWFDRLETLQGDAGARDLLKGAPTVPADARDLLDIDTPEQLHAAERETTAQRRSIRKISPPKRSTI